MGEGRAEGRTKYAKGKENLIKKNGEGKQSKEYGYRGIKFSFLHTSS